MKQARRRSTALVAAIPVAVGINLAMATIVNLLKLPLFLDSTGTIAVGVLFGPIAGALTGVTSNLIAGLVISPVYPWFIVTSAFVGLAAGFLGRRRVFERWWIAAGAGLLVGVITAALSAPVATYVFSGVTPAGSYSVMVAFLKATGQTLAKSALLAGLASDPVDKAVSFAMVALLIRSLPKTVIERFRSSRAENRS